MMEESSEKLSAGDVIICTGKMKRFDGAEFKETKRRPAVVICAKGSDGNRITLAAPLCATAEEQWKGPRVRYCINPTKSYLNFLKSLTGDELETLLGTRSVDFANFNHIREISQVAVNNAFFVENANFRKKIGSIDVGDYQCIRYMFREYCVWLKGDGLHLA